MRARDDNKNACRDCGAAQQPIADGQFLYRRGHACETKILSRMATKRPCRVGRKYGAADLGISEPEQWNLIMWQLPINHKPVTKISFRQHDVLYVRQFVCDGFMTNSRPSKFMDFC
jgi:hypothetical protein